MKKANYRFSVFFFGVLLWGNPAFASSQYACKAWEVINDTSNSLGTAPQPFIMQRDGDILHIQDEWNLSITIYKFGSHNKLFDLYKSIDKYGTTTVFYFKHAHYLPDSREINPMPKAVRLVKVAIDPKWMTETNCYLQD